MKVLTLEEGLVEIEVKKEKNKATKTVYHNIKGIYLNGRARGQVAFLDSVQEPYDDQDPEFRPQESSGKHFCLEIKPRGFNGFYSEENDTVEVKKNDYN